MECVIISADQEALMSLGGLLKSLMACRQHLTLIGLDYGSLPEWEDPLRLTETTQQ